MWHFRTWFSRHGGVGLMVGLDELRCLFQPMILSFYDSFWIRLSLAIHGIQTVGGKGAELPPPSPQEASWCRLLTLLKFKGNHPTKGFSENSVMWYIKRRGRR